MKKILSGILAAAMVMSFASVATLAVAASDATAISWGTVWDDTEDEAWDTNNGTITVNTDDFSIDGEDVIPNSVILVPIVDDSIKWTGGSVAPTSLINDKDYFKFDVDKDTNGKMIKKISLLTDKKVNGTRYDLVLKFELADSTTTNEIHTDGTITFEAKKDSDDYTGDKKVASSVSFVDGDLVSIDYSFWINNAKSTNDDNPDSGDRVYFDPDDNDTNTLIWGDDRAALKFEADDDASKFYARLSTSTDRTLYAEYGDPVDADLWFYDFVTNPTIPSTSRATLTLGIPWDEDDDDYVPDPETCFIYEKDADGNLTDVTDKFTFSEDDEEIPGWSMKTRVLGTYVLSDTELDIEAINADDEDDDDAAADVTTPDGGKDIPQTGSSDMVNVAVVAAVVSLTAAGAVAFKKSSK